MKKKILNLKFSVFDKYFNSNNYKEQEKRIEEFLKIKNKNIDYSKLLKEKDDNKKLYDKDQRKNELKEIESIMYIDKKFELNKLKIKKYLELLDSIYRLLEKGRIEYQLTEDILNKRKKSVQNYYMAFINIFKGKIIKLNERQIKRRKSLNNKEIEEYKKNYNIVKRDFSPDINKLRTVLVKSHMKKSLKNIGNIYILLMILIMKLIDIIKNL